MSTHTHTRPHARTRRISAPAYYQGRPAALWLAALAPRSTTRTSPRTSCASESTLVVSDNT